MRVNLWKISTFTLATALAFTFTIAELPEAEAKKLPQPNMETARWHLKQAQTYLRRATPNKGGYRIKAIKKAQEAEELTAAGIKYANDHTK